MLASLEPTAETELNERVAEVIQERTRVAEALGLAGWPVTLVKQISCGSQSAIKLVRSFQHLESKGIVTRPFENEGVRVTVGT